jgi:hypothetical protein
MGKIGHSKMNQFKGGNSRQNFEHLEKKKLRSSPLQPSLRTKYYILGIPCQNFNSHGIRMIWIEYFQ